MKKKKYVILFSGLVIFTILSADMHILGKTTRVRRFILATGANYGGPQRNTLRYAVKDASSFISIMKKLGGTRTNDSILLIEPSRSTFISNVMTIKKKIIEAKKNYKRVEAIFYYSGHADEEGILLGTEKIEYLEIKKFIKTLPADVKIAILDSCSSGALAREKGGKIHSPFLLDTSNNMKGYAFMTSSSQNEVSQESDRIKGSFFTHYLIGGLRGAADMSKDGRVTLNEAYHYAYNETLGSTQKTLSGPQHPNYFIKMSGTGDVVVTNIRKSSSIMVLSKELQGRFFLRDANNVLVLELNKPSGRSIELGLEHGKYNIINSRGGRLYETNISLLKKKRFIVSGSLFKEAAKDFNIAQKGDSNENLTKFKDLIIGFSLFPQFGNTNTRVNIDLNLFGSNYAGLKGVSLGCGPSIITNDASSVQINVFGNFVYGNFYGLQASLINYVREKTYGLQVGYLGNFSKEGTSGAQVSSIFNYSGKEMSGVQISGIFNVADGTMVGHQAASIFNYAKKMKGFQASVINIAGEINGSQFGVVNIADSTSGFNIGVINVSKKSDAFSIGVFNYAERQNGFPLGLINLSKNGSADLVMWMNNITGMSAGLRFQSRNIYTMLAMGGLTYTDNKFEAKKLSRSFYMGYHIPLQPVYINVDAGYVNIDNEELFRYKDNNADQNVMQARVFLGVNFFETISFFVGSGISYAVNYHEAFVEGTYSPVFMGGVKISYWGSAR